MKKQREMIKHAFLKCGLSNKLDGSDNSFVDIKGIEGYELPTSESEEDEDGYTSVKPADIDSIDSDNSFESESDSDSN